MYPVRMQSLSCFPEVDMLGSEPDHLSPGLQQLRVNKHKGIINLQQIVFVCEGEYGKK